MQNFPLSFIFHSILPPRNSLFAIPFCIVAEDPIVYNFQSSPCLLHFSKYFLPQSLFFFQVSTTLKHFEDDSLQSVLIVSMNRACIG